ncbi:D-glycero-beta-D-manno-heptose-7-phosphate kinase [candidate division WOR-3 bacterium]|nr:D-glycero-beta-D-manno-heptose-7-phosphate kinase [candidate division WOR-3 bacterium]
MNLKNYIDNFKDKKILIIGDIMLDEYLWGRVDRISPEAPVPLVDIERESTSPGGAANVANNILSMGGTPILAGTIGKDPAGNILKKTLVELGIDGTGLVSIDNRLTTRKTRIIAADQQLVRFDREDRNKVDNSIKKFLLEFIKNRVNSVDAVLIEDYDKGLFNKQFIAEIINTFKDHIITADPKFDNFLYYNNVTVFKPNKRELERAMGVKLSYNNLEDTANKIKETLNCKNLVLTLGGDGMFVIGDKGKWQIPHKAMTEVHDTAGAGDTVISALTLSLVSGANIYESALIANYAAGIEVGKVGVVPVNKEELIAAVSDDD